MRALPAALLAVALAVPGAALAQPCQAPGCELAYPADAGVLNVRDFGAKGDGRTDDTAALRAALTASGGDTGHVVWKDRIVYLPAGTYLVSDTILKRYQDGRFASGMILVGESNARTVIRLMDHAPGFNDPASPKPVLMTTSKRIDTGGGRDYAGKGEGNDAYENFVESLTVDVGAGNPGAIGIDYLANNLGAVRNVTVRAPAGSGSVGIAMRRRWPGPALIQRVEVDGFDGGIDIANTEYGMTLSQVVLTGQHRFSLRNDGNAVSADRLVTRGAPVAIRNVAPGGMIVLSGGSLEGGRTLENAGTVVLRDVRLAGPGGPVTGVADGVLTGAAWKSVPAGTWSVPLDREPVPEAAGAWVRVAPPRDGAGRVDSADRIQAALDAGKPVVYLPYGEYWISRALTVPPGVRRILGMNATLRVLPERQAGFGRNQGMIVVMQGGPPLQIEHIAFDNTDNGLQTAVELAGPRTLVLQDVFGAGVVTLDRRPAGGEAFLDDTCCGLLHAAGSRPVIVRQFNSEGGGVRATNGGAPLLILGVKTEGYCTVVQTTGGGRTEIMGGLIYVVKPPSGPDMPAFTADGGTLVASLVEESQQPGGRYETFLRQGVASAARVIAADSMPARGLGRSIPLLQSGADRPGDQ